MPSKIENTCTRTLTHRATRERATIYCLLLTLSFIFFSLSLESVFRATSKMWKDVFVWWWAAWCIVGIEPRRCYSVRLGFILHTNWKIRIYTEIMCGLMIVFMASECECVCCCARWLILLFSNNSIILYGIFIWSGCRACLSVMQLRWWYRWIFIRSNVRCVAVWVSVYFYERWRSRQQDLVSSVPLSFSHAVCVVVYYFIFPFLFLLFIFVHCSDSFIVHPGQVKWFACVMGPLRVFFMPVRGRRSCPRAKARKIIRLIHILWYTMSKFLRSSCEMYFQQEQTRISVKKILYTPWTYFQCRARRRLDPKI